MKTGRPKRREIVLNVTERKELQSYARSRSLPHALVCRAKIVLMRMDTATRRSLKLWG